MSTNPSKKYAKQIAEAEERFKELSEKHKGFKKGTPEWREKDLARRRVRYWKHRDEEAAKKRERYAENREEKTAQKRASYQANIEKERKRSREAKKKEREENPERYLKRQREFYANNRDEQKEKILSNRYKRKPWLGLKRAADEYKRGDKSLSELSRLVDERLALANKRDSED